MRLTSYLTAPLRVVYVAFLDLWCTILFHIYLKNHFSVYFIYLGVTPKPIMDFLSDTFVKEQKASLLMKNDDPDLCPSLDQIRIWRLRLNPIYPFLTVNLEFTPKLIMDFLSHAFKEQLVCLPIRISTACNYH